VAARASPGLLAGAELLLVLASVLGWPAGD
jgi:hypothetical protein